MFRANSKIAIKVSDDGVIRIGSLYLLLNSRCKVQASLASGTRRGKNFAGRSPQWLAAEKILFIQNLLYIVVMIIHIIAGKLLWIWYIVVVYFTSVTTRNQNNLGPA